MKITQLENVISFILEETLVLKLIEIEKKTLKSK